jgi:two-component system, chemotaxis family, chemotaxis protein CheY
VPYKRMDIQTSYQTAMTALSGSPGRPEQNDHIGNERHTLTDRPLLMIVDDEASIRMYLKTLLESEGFTAIEAANGIEALKLFDRLGEAVSLLVTDLRMPWMRGTELAFAMRSEYPSVPVIFMSSEPASANCNLHDPARGLFYFEKPFPPHELISTVRVLLQEKSKVSYGR